MKLGSNATAGILAVPLILMIAGGGVLIGVSRSLMHLENMPWTWPAAAAAIGAVSSLPIAVRVYGRGKNSRQKAGMIALAFVTALAFAALTYGGGSYANVKLDDGTELRHASKVLARRKVVSRDGKNRKSYYLDLRQWRPNRSDPIHVRVPVAVFRDMKEGADVTVVTKPGWLGLPWVVRFE